MGEIADAILDGEFDMYSGEYIGPGVGYPRTLEKTGNSSGIRGVTSFLSKKGFKGEQINEVIKEYALSKGIVFNEKKKPIATICKKIQENFSQFAAWVDHKKKGTLKEENND